MIRTGVREISLRKNSFCNLTTIHAGTVESQEDLNERVRAAAFIGTLQASYTDFHYLRPVWKETTEKDALIGVSMTGIASGEVQKYDLEEAANVVKEENARVADMLGINKAARCSCVKPEGTSSIVLGSSSGIHAWHDYYYIRRMRVGKNESIYQYLKINHPEIIADDKFSDGSVIEIPQKAPENAITREDEDVVEFLERVKHFNNRWVKPGHRDGANTHNVSATVNVKDDEWDIVGQWMWENRESYNGLSVLPYDGGNYTQAPFESVDKQQYEEMVSKLKEVDLTNIVETEDYTKRNETVACGGGACEVEYL